MTIRRFRAHVAQAIERHARRLASLVGDDAERMQLVTEQAARLTAPATVERLVPRMVELPRCSTPPCACTAAFVVWEHMRRAGIETGLTAWGPFTAAQFCDCKNGEQPWRQ